MGLGIVQIQLTSERKLLPEVSVLRLNRTGNQHVSTSIEHQY